MIIDPSIAPPDIEFDEWSGFSATGYKRADFGWRSNAHKESQSLEKYLDKRDRERERAALQEEAEIRRAVRERDSTHRAYCFMFMRAVQTEWKRRMGVTLPNVPIWKSAIDTCEALKLGESAIISPGEQNKWHIDSQAYRCQLYLMLSSARRTAQIKYSLSRLPDRTFSVKRVGSYV